jgi:DNA-binding NtrC family response regulator
MSIPRNTRCARSTPPTMTARILIADPDPSWRDLADALRADGGQVAVCDSAAAALDELAGAEPDLLVAELQLPDSDGVALLERARMLHPDLAVVLVAAFGTVEDAVQAMRRGAIDFLSKPFSPDQLVLATTRALEQRRLRRENHDLRAALDDRLRLDNLIGGEPRMHAVFKTAKAVAATRTTVLLTGESGTGKTLLARAIHGLSERREQPFVEVNCGALPEALLESELFGHVRGAFTGAVKDRAGKFEAANGGTIFLDEIGTSSPAFQVKLLRVLQDRVIERLGEQRPQPVDVRVVLATNLDLLREVREQRFREDLYYRINVVAIEMPPLRERRGDIPSLVEHFLRRCCAANHRPRLRLAPAVLDAFVAAPWPGNVRQLENVVERAVVLCEGEEIGLADLPPDLVRPAAAAAAAAAEPADDGPVLPLREALAIPEKRIIERALARLRGNRKETAAALGINRSTLFNKMRRYGLLGDGGS